MYPQQVPSKVLILRQLSVTHSTGPPWFACSCVRSTTSWKKVWRAKGTAVAWLSEKRPPGTLAQETVSYALAPGTSVRCDTCASSQEGLDTHKWCRIHAFKSETQGSQRLRAHKHAFRRGLESLLKMKWAWHGPGMRRNFAKQSLSVKGQR